MIETLQNLNYKHAQPPLCTYIKIVHFQEFKKIHAQQFKANAQMRAEHGVVPNVHHIHDVFWVIFLQKLQNLELDPRLVNVFLLVLHKFESDFLPSLVVNALESSAERSFAQKLHDFVSVSDVVTYLVLVVSTFIVVPTVELLGARCVDLGSSWQTDKVDFLKF